MVTRIRKGTKKEDFDKKLAELKGTRNFDAQKYCGIIRLKEDPVAIQKKLRDEWE